MFVGVDVGSLTTKVVLLSEGGELLWSSYRRNMGRPLEALKETFEELARSFDLSAVRGLGATGSGRHLVRAACGGGLVRNEITAHAVAAMREVPEVRTILEIGGQDSKLIVIRDGVVVDFSMNTVCAAGTGSFLDHQAQRLGIPVEELGRLALRSKNPVRIAGRCTVFAESDMIHKQQAGYPVEDIVAGLMEAMARNFIANLGRGKKLEGPFVFQGGVAANAGMRWAFERMLGERVLVPQNHKVMGAIGAALLAMEAEEEGPPSLVGLLESDLRPSHFECQLCPNRCEVAVVLRDGDPVACWGDRCGRWGDNPSSARSPLRTSS